MRESEYIGNYRRPRLQKKNLYHRATRIFPTVLLSSRGSFIYLLRRKLLKITGAHTTVVFRPKVSQIECKATRRYYENEKLRRFYFRFNVIKAVANSREVDPELHVSNNEALDWLSRDLINFDRVRTARILQRRKFLVQLPFSLPTVSNISTAPVIDLSCVPRN